MTLIQWCDRTWNPIVGCTQIINGDPTLSGCRNCYAQRQAYRNQAMKLRGYEGVAKKTSKGEIVWTGKVNLVKEALAKPLQRQKPTTWFVNSMSDLFHPEVSFEWVDLIFGIMSLCPQHTFQILTKRPERMLEWSDRTHRGDWCSAVVHHAWKHVCNLGGGTINLDIAIRHPGFPLPNVMLGVSVETQAAADERIPLLLETPAAMRFLSCEPLLEPLDLSPWVVSVGQHEKAEWYFSNYGSSQPLQLIIVGGESGHNARRCSLDWIRSLIKQCKAAGISVFVKQLGSGWAKESGTIGIHSKGGDPDVWEPGLRIRELPDVSDRLSPAASNSQEIG